MGRFSLAIGVSSEYRADSLPHLAEIDGLPPVAGLLANLTMVQTDPAADFERSVTPRWTPTATDLPEDTTEEWLQRVAGISTELADRSADVRALLKAYSQAAADPRPELSMLAKWQRVSPGALRHRYNEQHVQSVRDLLKPEPLIDIVLESFIAVVDSDFKGISPELDEQLSLRTRMRSIVDEEFVALFGENAPSRWASSEIRPPNGSPDRSMTSPGS